ncbi:MAG: ATP-dependent Clp protease ATP-binding subunit, partial [Oscillospiraceae bacterium]|nr:ATP-dependent Clp protease ATP-binding subunit [Oscillospiraceae bacterium]
SGLRDCWQCGAGRGKLNVTEMDIARIVSDQTGIETANLTKAQSERLLEMEQVLSSEVIGQNHAVRSVVKAIKRNRVGMSDPCRPIASFIFLGPTGVGKTQLCKALAKQMFGTEDSMIRLDMSEYMERHTVSKIIGSPPGYVGYDDGGQLTEKVRRKPYSVILLDEIEKAHADVFNLLLQVLEEGFLTDSQGKKVNFRNTIIIMTSNIGAKVIFQKNDLGFGSQTQEERAYEKVRREVLGELKKHFPPEFINRVDELIVFNKLSQENMEKIAASMLNNLAQRMHELKFKLEYTPALLGQIAKEGYDQAYGARPLRRKIQTNIEDVIADGILKEDFHAGDIIKCDYSSENGVLIKSV